MTRRGRGGNTAAVCGHCVGRAIIATTRPPSVRTTQLGDRLLRSLYERQPTRIAVIWQTHSCAGVGEFQGCTPQKPRGDQRAASSSFPQFLTTTDTVANNGHDRPVSRRLLFAPLSNRPCPHVRPPSVQHLHLIIVNKTILCIYGARASQ